MYGKIFSSLYQGTLRGNAHGILVFTNLIASCDKCGIADRHWRAIAEEVGLSVDEVKAAIAYLESPDEESRSREHDGRRLVRIAPDRAWGWEIVNYAKYRDMRDEEDRRAYMREYMRTRRQVPDEPPVNTPLTPVNNVSCVNSGKLPLAKADAEAEVDAEVDTHAKSAHATEADDQHDIAGQPSSAQPIDDAQRWGYVRAEPWAKALIASDCKIGPQKWPAWKALIDKHGLDRVVSVAKTIPADVRWSDRTEMALEKSGGQAPIAQSIQHRIRTIKT